MFTRGYRGLLLAIAVLGLSFSHSIVSGRDALKASAPVSTIASKSDSDQGAQEIQMLKAQLATTKEFTDKILSTVYWTLGSMVVIATLLVGFSWFNGARLHERDIAAIRSELTSNLDTNILTLHQEIESLTSKMMNNVSTASSESSRLIVDAALKPIQATLKSLATSLQETQKNLAYNSLQNEAWYWETKDVAANEFDIYQDILRLAIKEKDSLRISDTLQKLKSLLTPGFRLIASDVTDLVGLIDGLPTQYAIHVEALRNSLRTVKTY